MKQIAARSLSLILVGSSFASAQTTLSVEIRGTVTSVVNALQGTPFDGAALGDAFMMHIEPTVPGPFDTTDFDRYDVDAATTGIQIGRATATSISHVSKLEIWSMLGTGDAFEVSAIAEPGGVGISVDLHDLTGQSFPSAELLDFPARIPGVAFTGTSTIRVTAGAGDLEVTLSELVVGGISLRTANYCGPAVPNSTGVPSSIFASGSGAVFSRDLTLFAAEMPPGLFGIFVGSSVQGFLPANTLNSNGNLCLGGNISRFSRPQEILATGSTGSFQLAVDPLSIPLLSSTTQIVQGETWYFQAWHRDNVGQRSNFSDGLAVSFP